MRSAWKLFKRGRIAEALERYEAALGSEAEACNAYVGRSRCLARLGPGSDALRSAQIAAVIDASRGDVQHQLAYIALQIDALDIAANTIRRARLANFIEDADLRQLEMELQFRAPLPLAATMPSQHEDPTGFANDPSAVPSHRRFVFICGMPRSGTTAFGQLLGLSPDVVVFNELYSPWQVYRPSMFAQVPVAECASRKSTFDKLMAKYDQAAILCEKQPLLFACMTQTLLQFEQYEVAIVHVVRPLLDVARSYQRRADDPDDSWPAVRDYRHCIRTFGSMMRNALEVAGAHRFLPNHRLTYISFNQVFCDATAATDAVRSSAGVAVNRAEVQQFLDSSPRWGGRCSVPDEEILEYAQKVLDQSVVAEFGKLAGCPVL